METSFVFRSSNYMLNVLMFVFHFLITIGILGAAEGWYLAKMVVSYGYAPSTSMKQFGIVFIFAFPYFIYTHSRSGDS